MTRRGGSIGFVAIAIALVVACSSSSSSSGAAVVHCGQTIAQYCDGKGSSVPCAKTWVDASAQCALITSLYACADKNVYLEGATSAYYDAMTGALVAIGGSGACLAGPADFTFPVCPQGSYVECPRCAEACGCVAPGGHSGCCPGDVATFAPSWVPPTSLHQAACTDAQTAALVDCFSDLPDDATCTAFLAAAANATCLGCAVSRSTASAYGPIIQGATSFAINEAGCLALAEGDVSAGGCGAKVGAARDCEGRACEQSCPLFTDDNGVSLASLQRCEKLAAGKGCKAYADAASCGLALEGDAGVGGICAQTSGTFRENAKAMVTLFCGGIVGDAGPGDTGEGG